MHPDCAGYILELYTHFRQVLVDQLTSEQLQLHDFYSSRDPLYHGDECLDEFPLIDGLPEMLNGDDDELTYLPSEARLQEQVPLQRDGSGDGMWTTHQA